MICKGFRFQLKTDARSENTLAWSDGSCRFVWNKALALQKDRLESGQKLLNYSGLREQLKQWKSKEEAAWRCETHSQPLQQTMKNLDRALRDAFDRKAEKRFPRFTLCLKICNYSANLNNS